MKYVEAIKTAMMTIDVPKTIWDLTDFNTFFNYELTIMNYELIGNWIIYKIFILYHKNTLLYKRENRIFMRKISN